MNQIIRDYIGTKLFPNSEALQKLFKIITNPVVKKVAMGLAIAAAGFIAYKGIQHVTLNHKSKTQSKEAEYSR